MVSKVTLWRRANPEKAKALRKKEKPRSPEAVAASYRRRKDADPEAWNAKRREQYERDADGYRRRSLKWAKLHPEKNAELSRRRYARLKGVEVGPINLDEVWNRQRGWCPLCLHRLERDEAQQDHKKPIDKGGSHTQDNIQFVHASCNAKKGNKYVEPKSIGPVSGSRN